MISRTRSGFALFAVLWIVVLVATVGLAASLLARTSLAAVRHRVDQTADRWRAEGCASLAMDVLARRFQELPPDSPPERAIALWDGLDEGMTEPVPECEGVVSLVPSGLSLDVNALSATRLRRLLSHFGLGGGSSDSLVDALLDWRDADQIERPSGAEARWYVANGRLTPRNAPLVDDAELALVRGFGASADDRDGWREMLTVEPGKLWLSRAPIAALATLPGASPEALAALRHSRSLDRESVRTLSDWTRVVQGPARDSLLRRYAELGELVASEPGCWWLEAKVGTTRVRYRIERAGREIRRVARREQP